MNVSMGSINQTTVRPRVMIVDPEWHIGLKLADCLATEGYHAVLVRDLESSLAELGELQPEAILLSADSRDEDGETFEVDTLQAIHALCPRASVLALVEPRPESPVVLSPLTNPPERRPLPFIPQRVEEWLHARLGMPCVRVQ